MVLPTLTSKEMLPLATASFMCEKTFLFMPYESSKLHPAFTAAAGGEVKEHTHYSELGSPELQLESERKPNHLAATHAGVAQLFLGMRKELWGT